MLRLVNKEMDVKRSSIAWDSPKVLAKLPHGQQTQYLEELRAQHPNGLPTTKVPFGTLDIVGLYDRRHFLLCAAGGHAVDEGPVSDDVFDGDDS